MNNYPVIKQYQVHGVRLETRTEHLQVSEALHYRLGPFETEASGPADFRFEYHCVSEEALGTVPRPEGEAVRAIAQSEVSEVLYDPGADRMYVSLGGRMKTLWEALPGVCRVYYPETELEHRWRLTHPMFTLPLVDALKRRGRYNVHAAGLCVEGKGLLFPGGSGYGKSTLTLALLRAGYGFLADDLVFLDPREDGVHLLAFPDEIDVTENTARMFPELAPVLATPRRPDWPKRQVRVPEIYGTGWVPECRPAAVICPRVAHAERTELEPLSPDGAFFELVSSVTFTEQASSQAHLDAIGALLRQVPCYRMHTGRDLDALPARLAELVA